MFKLRHKGRDGFQESRNLETFKHFRIIRRLGRGSYSTVYEVERVDDHIRYALKATDVSQLNHEENLGMVEEIRLLASLRHPNVVKYYEAFVDSNYLCIVTELVGDGDVYSLLTRCREEKRTLPESSVWSIVIQALAALAHLHSCRLLHRDIKPGNLLLSGRRVLLADFGISRLLDHIFTRTQLGTPGYMSPEMWRGEPYSLSSDVWALGCVAYELCTLHPLFEGASEAEIRGRVLSSYGFVLPSQYGGDLYSFISFMLDPDPVMRYTARELLDLPAVAARLHYLPPDARAALTPGTRALAPHIIKPITVPRDLRELNALLPPAQYEGGDAVAQLLSSRCASEGNLEAIVEEGGGMRKCASHGDLELCVDGNPKLASDPAQSLYNSIPRRSAASVMVGDLTWNRQMKEVGGRPEAFPSTPFGNTEYKGPRSNAVARSSVSVATVSELRKQRMTDRQIHHPRDATAQMKKRFSQQNDGGVDDMGFDDPRPFELCPINRSSFVMPRHTAFVPKIVPDLNAIAHQSSRPSRPTSTPTRLGAQAPVSTPGRTHLPSLETSRSTPSGKPAQAHQLSPSSSVPLKLGREGKSALPEQKSKGRKSKLWKFLPSL